jgi:hypothetical protein
VENSTGRCITYYLEIKMKYLLLTAMLLVAPLAASAQQLSDEQRDALCMNMGKLTGATASMRDQGQTASAVYAAMIANGLDQQIAHMIVKMVYDDMPTASPETVAGVSYLGCMEATKQ